jgi:hypothetical protein
MIIPSSPMDQYQLKLNQSMQPLNQRRRNLKKKNKDLIDFFNMIEALVLFGIILVIFAPICWLWVRGLDDMQKNHPDYKGNDLFGETE